METQVIGVLVRHGENDYEFLMPENMPDFEFEGGGLQFAAR